MERSVAPEADHVLARDVLDALESPACVVDGDSRVIVVNAAWQSFSRDNDGTDEATGVGVRYLDVCAAHAAPGQEGGTDVALGLREVLSGRLDRYEQEYPCHAPTQDRWFSVRITPAELATGRGAVIRHVDVSERRLAEAQVRRHTLQDPLTGLANRVQLAQQLTLAVEQDTGMVGVVVVDLDQFGKLNDSLGHAVADVVLREAAARLATHVGPRDTVARTSAAEFVVLWRDVPSAAEVTARARAVQDALSEPFDLEVTTLQVSCSVGTVTARPGGDGQDLLLAASAALQQAREQGRGRLCEATPGLRSGTATHRRAEADLARAIAGGELVLHYQPVLDLRTGRPVAVEALVRWQHPEHGLVLPDSFVPLAESTGLIASLGEWVLRRACQDAVAGPAAGLEVAVNLSTGQLTQPGLLGQVRAVLTQTGLPPHRLCLEVTESAIMVDEQAAGRVLRGLVDLGVRIAIDDFGTGYSSLLYIRRFPVSILKLDRAFVSGLPSAPDDEAICASVVRLATAVNATCIAEGVETREQQAILTAMGCDQAQGWLWAKAVPREELAEALAACGRVGTVAPAALRTPPQRPLSSEAWATIHEMRDAGASLHAIAAALNRSGAVNPAGVRWGVRSVARYAAAD